MRSNAVVERQTSYEPSLGGNALRLPSSRVPQTTCFEVRAGNKREREEERNSSGSDDDQWANVWVRDAEKTGKEAMAFREEDEETTEEEENDFFKANAVNMEDDDWNLSYTDSTV